jgi:hypothetical protein
MIVPRQFAEAASRKEKTRENILFERSRATVENGRLLKAETRSKGFKDDLTEYSSPCESMVEVGYTCFYRIAISSH